MRRLLLLLATLFLLPTVAHAQSVLLIYDTTGTGTPALQSALTGAGYSVTLSDTAETSYTGTNPSPAGFDVVIHLNGPTHATAMPSSGRSALITYVQNGGGFIHGEWNAYEVDETGGMSGFEPLTLFTRTGGTNGSGTVNVVAAQAGHPVLAGIPSTFTIPGGSGFGTDGMRSFGSQQATLLASDQTGQGAIAVREFGSGRIVGFHTAGNYGGASVLGNATLQQLYVNAVAWAASGASNQAPTADAGGPYSVNQGTPVFFDGSGSTDLDGTISLYEWDCTSDGSYDTSSTSPTGASCTYTAPGTFSVELRVTDNAGDSDTDNATVNVTNSPPSADAGGPYTVGQGQAVALDGSGSTDSDGTITLYEWDCTSDTNIDVTSASPTGNACTYPSPGTYTLTLIVTDNNGATGISTGTVTVANAVPVADAGGPYNGAVPGVAQPVDGSGSTDSDGTIVSWEWDCEDDGVFDVTGQLASCVWAVAGSYTMRLRVTDNDGDTGDDTTSITVATKSVLFVSDATTDTNIPDPLQADGHYVQIATSQYVTASGETTALTNGLATFDVVVWSATGVGSGGLNDGALTLATLEAYVLGGGSLFVTGYDSVASPTDSALATLLGGSGPTDQCCGTPVTMGPISSDRNAVTFGVADLRGVTPTGGHTDMDSFVSVNTADTVSLADFTSNGNAGWTLRTLGLGRIAYVANGQSGSSGHASWTTAGNVYNGALRNFVANSDGAVPNTAPIADAGGPYSANQGVAVSLDGSGSSDADGGVVLWEWDCENDGTVDVTSTSPSGDTCTYANPLSGTIALTVTDNYGDTATATATVTITNTPPVADAGGPYLVGQGVAQTMDGTGSGDPDGTIIGYAWDCEDDGSYDFTSVNPNDTTCTWGSPGTYTARLQVTDDDGDTATDTATVIVFNAAPTAHAGGPYTGTKGNPVAFDGSGSSDPDGSVVQWEWDCETDGTYDVTSTQSTGSTCTYAAVGGFTVTLRVTDDDGDSATATSTVTVGNDPPTANAGGPYTGVEGVGVAVDGSASADPGGSIILWEWDCQDDGTFELQETQATSSCTYPDDGVYTIRLRVTDDDGAVSSLASSSATITNVDPTITSTSFPTGDEGINLTFAAAATDAAGDVLTFSWDFGDGATASGPTVTHAYDDDGSFTATLTVTDDDGGSDSTSSPVSVSNVAPTLTLGGPTTGDEGALLSFTATGSDVAGDLASLTYSWDFGDGFSDTGTAPDHAYGDNGTWTISVTVDDGDGGTTTETLTVTTSNVDPTITSTAPINASQGALYSYGPVVDDPGTDDTFTWTLDSAAPAGMTVDATTGLIEWTPTYDQSLTGTFPITLTVTDDDGAAAVEAWTITVSTVDTDGDGLPDDWETANGFDPNDPSDGLLDPDADGLDNLTEFGLGQDPNVFDGPTAVTPVSPVAGAEVTSDTPDLVFDNATDPQGEVLTYDVEVYEDAALTTLLTSATALAEDGSGTTTWTVDVALTENASVWWRARANDPFVAGPWSAEEEFFVNTTDEAPDVPVLVWPLGGQIAGLAPTLLWSPAADPDNDDVTYDVEVWDELAGLLVESETGIVGGDTEVSWSVFGPLTEDTLYSWTVRAVDEDGLVSDFAPEELFIASDANGPPTGTAFTNPLDGDSLFTTAVVFAASEGTDPEGTELEYQFEYDLVATFDGVDYAAATVPASGTGTVEWAIADDGLTLPENATVYARVRAIDGDGLASSPDTISFFVRGQNDPPEVPTLISPAQGTEGDGSPTLEVSEPVDPEGDEVTVDFVVARDIELTDVIVERTGVALDGSGSVTWAVEVALDGEVFWTARAVDADGEESEWAAPWRYVVPEPGDGDDDDDDDGGGGDTGCDCQNSVAGTGAPMAWLLLLLPLALRRRR